MANSRVFCNVPWTNLHINWDGSYGACCSEQHKPYDESEWTTYNLKQLTVPEWYNTAPMKSFRTAMISEQSVSQCNGCYYEESNGHESRRIKENFKTVIFTEQAFDKSYQQSRWHNRFESAKQFTDVVPPIDWHVDLGNECNLSCKMCVPRASSSIADKYRKWNISFDARKNWTTDDTAWNNFVTSIDQCTINRLHFMGGEPMLSKRFREIIDHLIATNRTDISISFVTNGTIQDQNLIDKLKTFRSADIEISLESISSNNHYIRQGSNTEHVLDHVRSLIKQQTDTFKVILRSVPQLLNANNYDQYILWAWNQGVSIQGIPLFQPSYLAVNVLPIELRKQLVTKYQQVKDTIGAGSFNISTIATGRDTSRLDIQLMRECDTVIHLLEQLEPHNVNDLRRELCTWLSRWDQEYKLDARDYYPEYQEFLESIGYGQV